MNNPSSKTLTGYEVCGNINPRPPIDIAPRVPITPAEAKSFLELQADEAAATERIARGERIWEITRNLAHGTNVAGGPSWEGSGSSAEAAGEIHDPSAVQQQADENNAPATAPATPSDIVQPIMDWFGWSQPAPPPTVTPELPVRDPPVEWDWPPPVEIAPSASQEAAGASDGLSADWLGLVRRAELAGFARALNPYQSWAPSAGADPGAELMVRTPDGALESFAGLLNPCPMKARLENIRWIALGNHEDRLKCR